MDNFKLSEHFSFYEMTNSTSFPFLVDDNRAQAMYYIYNLKKNVENLEVIRSILGVPLKVTSGFRGEYLNKAVKGSKTSKHKLGICADIVPIGMGVDEAFNTLVKNKEKCVGMAKLIIENIKGKGWLHIQAKLDESEPTQIFSTTDGKYFTLVG